jgi:hypothetical protein
MMLMIGWKHKEGKVIYMHAKMVYGAEDKVLHSLNLGTRWRCAVSFTVWPLYTQQKIP